MATGTYGIANVKDITTSFSVTLNTQSALCPTYSMITANSNLGVSGATYAANQLVLYKHIYKKAAATTYSLTISNLNAFLSAMGYEDEDGYWELYPNGTRYDGGSYPTSYLQYNGNNYIKGTQAQWTTFYNLMYNNDYWDAFDLKNSETDDTFSLYDYCTTSIMTAIKNLKNGSNQTISLSVPTTTSAVIDLNNEWTTGSTNPSSTSYYSFESIASKGVANSGDYIYLKIKGYTTYTLYIRSNGENYFDYVMVSKPDVSITHSTSYSSSNVYAHTRGLANDGTALSNYKAVTFTGLTTGEHTITIVYRKDSGGDEAPDAGYVLIPKGSASYKNMYSSSPVVTNSKNIVFGFYDADLVHEIDMTVTVTIYSNNGQTYTKTCDIAGGYNNGAYANRFYTGCTIPIQYTGTTPTDITYKYTIKNRSTTEECYFDFAEYYNGTRTYDREGFYIEGTKVKESDGTNYVATAIPFDSGFFTGTDPRLEFYFYNK